MIGGCYSLNKSSAVTTLCTSLQCPDSAMPFTVIIVILIDFELPMALENRSTLLAIAMESSLLTVYGVFENFISQMLTILSARSMSISICAPREPSDAVPICHV